jgi:hypothetical protein
MWQRSVPKLAIRVLMHIRVDLCVCRIELSGKLSAILRGLEVIAANCFATKFEVKRVDTLKRGAGASAE